MRLTVNRTTIVLIVFLLFGGYLLWQEHSHHIWPYLPWLIFLACPLLHFFMHGGHGHGGHGHGGHGHGGHAPDQDDARVPRDVSDAEPPKSARVPEIGGRHE